MRRKTADVRYVFIHHLAFSQFWCNHAAVTSLPTSNTAPMIAMGITAPAKIAMSPTIEYHAATPAIASAVMNVSIAIISTSDQCVDSPRPFDTLQHLLARKAYLVIYRLATQL